jgi:hypothetical protein
MGIAVIEASHETTAARISNEYELRASKRNDESRRKASIALWIGQGLLALVFLAAGGMKLAMPLDVLAQLSPLPALFLKLVGAAEICGVLGLILPGLLRIWTALTPLAASGLVLIMICATVATMATGPVAPALLPLVVGIVAGSVAYGRWRVAPLHTRDLSVGG